jgi:hypothetical protein
VADLTTPDHGRIEQRLRQDLHDTGELILGSSVTSDLLSDTRELGLRFRARQHAVTFLVVLALAVAVVVILISPALGRAAPSGDYRPPLPPDTIELGCYPLPRGLTFDFPYQVRSDGNVDGRRILTLHYDELVASEVRRRLGVALDRAGLPRRTATVTAFPDVSPGAIVRGTVVLRLPVVRLSSVDPACIDPRTTKRFPPDWAPSTEYG